MCCATCQRWTDIILMILSFCLCVLIQIRHAAANVLRECWLLHRASPAKGSRDEHRRHQRCLLEAIRVWVGQWWQCVYTWAGATGWCVCVLYGPLTWCQHPESPSAMANLDYQWDWLASLVLAGHVWTGTHSSFEPKSKFLLSSDQLKSLSVKHLFLKIH